MNRRKFLSAVSLGCVASLVPLSLAARERKEWRNIYSLDYVKDWRHISRKVYREIHVKAAERYMRRHGATEIRNFEFDAAYDRSRRCWVVSSSAEVR